MCELLLGRSHLSGQLGYLFLKEITDRKLQMPHKTHFLFSDKLAFNSKTKSKNLAVSQGAALCRATLSVSGAVSEGGHHVPSTLGHCPAVLLCRALESAVSPGAVRAKGEHLLQVLKHIIKESSTKGPLLKLSSLPVHSLLVDLEVGVKVCLLVGLMLGVGVKVVLLSKKVIVFEDVIKVEGLEVLVEVVVTTSSTMALPW